MKMTTMISKEQALPGHEKALKTADQHLVLQSPMQGPFTPNLKRVVVGMGCFWGAERLFWQMKGVFSTAVGYAGGYTANPTYEEVCSGMTGHAEVVQIIYDPEILTLEDLLATFWQEHDPTQGMRQGNDIGTQYRSAVYLDNETDLQIALTSKQNYQSKLAKNNHSEISTEIKQLDTFFYAEDYHQQYLAKVPNGYCGLKGLGIKY